MTKRELIADYVRRMSAFDFRQKHTEEEWKDWWGRFVMDLEHAGYESSYTTHAKEIGAYIGYVIDNTDLVTAPASTRFHGDFKTGLIQHSSLTAYYFLKGCYHYLTEEELISPVEYIIAGLFHDFCKVDSYTVDYRNVKDEKGNWTKQPFYKVRDGFNPMGHGVDSVWKLLRSPIANYLDDKIYEAIRWHMGTWEVSDSDDNAWHEAQKQNKLCLLLEFADRQAASWEGV